MTDNLNILLLRPKASGDYQTSVYRSFFSIISELQKKIKTIDLWVVEQGGTNSNDSASNVYNIFQFSDALNLIDKLKPDVILLFSDYEFLSRSILFAASYRNIPRVTLLSLFFEMHLLEPQRFPRVVHGRFTTLRIKGLTVIRKYIFMLRTLKQIRYSWISILSIMLRDLYYSLNSFEPRYRYGGGDLNIVPTPFAKELLVLRGIREETILVSGDCGMDYLYEKLMGDSNFRSCQKKQILFITEPMVEHGYWTEAERKFVVTSLVRAIVDLKETHNIQIKIHPTSESIKIYRNILDPIDPSIEIIQEGDIVPLIKQSDLIIALGHSSAIFPAVLLSKVVILANFLNENLKGNIFLDSGLATECKNLSQLIELVEMGNYKIPNKKELTAFISKTIYLFDGLCSRRAAEGIMSVVKSKEVGRNLQ